MTIDEFKEIGHCGGKLTIKVVTDATQCIPSTESVHKFRPFERVRCADH
jgi:hypothetical protein